MLLSGGRTPTPPPSAHDEACALLDRILEEHGDWKASCGFAKPSLWMERDALLLLVALLLAVAAVAAHLVAAWPFILG